MFELAGGRVHTRVVAPLFYPDCPNDLARPVYRLTSGRHILSIESTRSTSQGEPLPELDTAATDDPSGLVGRLLDAADSLDIDARLVPEKCWQRGDATGYCKPQPTNGNPRVEVLATDSDAESAGVLIHEYAHALLHVDVDGATEKTKREVEAEAIAYVVGRYFGLDMDGSAFYLAAWQDDERETLHERLRRISETASEVIQTVETSDERG